MLRVCTTLCSLLGAGGGGRRVRGLRVPQDPPDRPTVASAPGVSPRWALREIRERPIGRCSPQSPGHAQPQRNSGRGHVRGALAMAPAFWLLNITGGTDLLGSGKPPRPNSDVPDGRAIPERAWSAQRCRGPPTPPCLQGGWDPLCSLRPSLGLTEGALRKSGRPLALPLENDHRPGVGAWKTTAL